MSNLDKLFELAAQNHERAAVSSIFEGVINMGAYVATVKKRGCPYLSVAGIIGAQLKLGEIPVETAREFVKISLENPELLTAQWASLDWLLNGGEYYKASKSVEDALSQRIRCREYNEAMALLFLIGATQASEKNLKELAELVSTKNKELSDKYAEAQAEADKLASAF